MSVSFGLVSIISVKKAFDSGERPASQSEHLCRTNANLSDKGTARSPQVRRKIRGGKIFEKSMPNLRYGFRGWVVSLCNITTMRAPKQTLGTDWSGRERTSGPKRFDRLIYCKRKKYSDKETDGWPNIYRNHYPDMRMIRCRSGEIYNSTRWLN